MIYFELIHTTPGSPSTSISEINARQSLVAFFHVRGAFREDLMGVLADSEDAGRIVQKFLLGRGDAGDLHAVNTTISVWSKIRKRIEDERRYEFDEDPLRFSADQWASLDALVLRMTDLGKLGERIDKALKRKPSAIADGLNGDEEELGTAGRPDVASWRFKNSDWAIKPE